MPDLAGVSRSKRLVGSLTRPVSMGHLKVAVSGKGSVAPSGCPPPPGSQPLGDALKRILGDEGAKRSRRVRCIR